jgi:ribosomal protein L14
MGTKERVACGKVVSVVVVRMKVDWKRESGSELNEGRRKGVEGSGYECGFKEDMII